MRDFIFHQLIYFIPPPSKRFFFFLILIGITEYPGTLLIRQYRKMRLNPEAILWKLCFMIFYIQPCEDILGCKLCNQVKERMREKKREREGGMSLKNIGIDCQGAKVFQIWAINLMNYFKHRKNSINMEAEWEHSLKYLYQLFPSCLQNLWQSRTWYSARCLIQDHRGLISRFFNSTVLPPLSIKISL